MCRMKSHSVTCHPEEVTRICVSQELEMILLEQSFTACMSLHVAPSAYREKLRVLPSGVTCTVSVLASIQTQSQQECLAVASIARDDPSTLPGDEPFPRARMHRDRNAR